MKKFKVICTGISGSSRMLTPQMGILTEDKLPLGSFDEKVAKGEIVEVKDVILETDDSFDRALEIEKLRELGFDIPNNISKVNLIEFPTLIAEAKEKEIDLPEGSKFKEVKELLKA